jgi:tetratricopeptide (TPR) repeat protein
MPTSFQQTLSLTCPRCGQSFEAAIWLIVDAAERPDLLEKIQAGTLHQVVCPHCQFQGEVDAPLLLYNPPLPEGEGLGVRLLFSPAQGTTAEQDQEQALALLERLRQSLGDAWQDDWLSRGLPAVPRPLLPLALREGLEAALRKMQEAAAAQLPPEVREVLEELARSGVEIRTPEDLERALENRPDLREKLEAAQRKMQEEAAGSRVAAGLRALLEEIARLRRPSEMPRQVELCERALGMVEREDNPVLWGVLQVELANALQQNPLGNRAENLEKAIHHYQQALEVLTRQAYPQQWAAAQNNLAAAYAERIRGERAENLEQAIFHYQQALEVYTRQAYPEQWAMTQHNLGNAYADRIRGERAENLEQAIFHYQQALEVLTRQAYPEQWAATQNNLGEAYRNRIRGERAENLEQAIFHYQQALAVYTRQAYPEQWAAAQNNLAAAYAERIRGERAENLEQAIFHFQQALEVRTRQAYPEDWAMTQNNLGEAYRNRIRGERAENLEQAIFHYQQALEVYTRQAYPEQWAGTQNNLGSAYLYRIRGERAENLEQAIFHYQQALEVYTRQAYPEQWAMTQHNLGNAYQNRIRGERAENLEQALFHYQQALEVLTRQAYPEQWAATQNNLGEAYRNRIRGERAENLEQAIFHYQQALAVYTRQAYPQQWAATQNNLAIAYRNRIRGERAENLEQAIFHYQQALEVRTRQAYPEDWAGTQNNLAVAYSDRIRGERAENLEQAIFHFQQALDVYTRQAYPEQWAATQNNLGEAYRNRIRGERAENLEQAIFHYQQALEVLTRQAYPEQWAMTQHNLGNAYQNRIRGERAENLEQALFHYQQALEVYTRQAYPVECRRTARNLGDLAFEQGDWQLACTAYTEAWLAQEILWRSTSLRPNKEMELREMRDIPARLAFAHIRLAQAHQALTTLESGRAQLLREALERNRRDLERLAEIGQQDLLTRYRALDERIETLQRLAAAGNRPPDWLAQMEQAQAERERVVAEIRRLPGYETFLRSLTAEQIQAQAADAPLVYLAATQHGGLALLVRGQGEPWVVELPQLTEERLEKQVWGVSEKEYRALQQQAYKENRQPPSLAELLGGYLGAYFRWRASLRPGTPKTEQETARQAWFEALESTLRWLGEAVMGPVLQALAAFLPQGSLVRLVPGGWLALLPPHAAILTADRGPQTAAEPSAVSRPPSVYALDHYTFAYVPSAQALYHARAAAGRPADSLLAVDNPDGKLTFSTMEIAEALRHFPASRRLAGKEATLQAVRQALPDHAVLHFSTHGWAGWGESEVSGLKLADGNLYLRDLFDLRLERARLGILSACESGLPGTELLEEVVSLPAVMMQAGVPGVLGSLWAVNDLSTAMLIARFYENWRERGLDLPQALREAQRWLRDLFHDESKLSELEAQLPESIANRFAAEQADAFFKIAALRDLSHPHYWAAFVFYGV